MPQLQWNTAGERLFEVGVDRGVLYVDGEDGVPWNGLLAVNESPSGGEITSYYIDGIKYLDHVSSEEFRATIEAFTYPSEFEECEGTVGVTSGLFATHQRKKSFGLSYRTLVGNDLESIEHGYKIHLVYGATVSPAARVHATIDDRVDPMNFSWSIVTKPPSFVGYKPTSHFIIDSREVPLALLNHIESILYGAPDEGKVPRLPSVPELLFIFQEFGATVFDAGVVGDEYFLLFDAGHISETQDTSIDAGGP